MYYGIFVDFGDNSVNKIFVFLWSFNLIEEIDNNEYIFFGSDKY